MPYYKEKWDDAKKHYEAFWEKSNTDRCCLAMWMGKQRQNQFEAGREYTCADRYTDPLCMHIGMMNYCEGTAFLCEAVPSKILDFGTAGMVQYFGCVPQYTPDTIWFAPILDEPDSSELRFLPGPFLEHKRITRELTELAGDRYFVGMNDNCGIIDALAHIRGTENLLIDMAENPDFIREARDKIIDVWKKTQTEFFEITKENNEGGSSHSWMHLWSPARHLQIQCDYSCMISPAMFEEFVLPELEETSSVFEHTTYHFDGVEQLRHLDMILSVKGIDNIQWTRVSGQPPTSESIAALRKIQKAGKGLVLFPGRDEVEFLMKNLSPVGLHLIIGGVKDREEAAAIEEKARAYAREKI